MVEPESTPAANVSESNQEDTPVPKVSGNYSRIRIDLTGTKYKVLKEAAHMLGWKVVTAKKLN
jgi:hypothetical protein